MPKNEQLDADVAKWQRAELLAPAPVVGVDRSNSRINGYVVAELGPFKSPGRGEFDALSLGKIIELGNAEPAGLKMRFAHPGLSSDGVGKFLARAKNFRLDGNKVRADAHINPTALKPSPEGGGTPLGEYVMDLAESDPGAMSSSLVVQADKEYRLEPDGTRKKDPSTGDYLPPLWRPVKLHASDVVDTGDAVNAFLSAEIDVEGLPDLPVREASHLLDQLFAGQERETVADRCQAFISRYLSRRFGDEQMSQTNPATPPPAAVPATQHAELTAQVAELAKSQKALTDAMTAQHESLKAEREESAKARSETKRVEEIAALCTMAKSTEAALFIADQTLSVDQVRKKLFEKLCAGNTLPGGGTDALGQGGDQDAKYKAEYANTKSVHQKLGVSETDYVKQRRLQDGLETQPQLLSYEWIEAQQNAKQKPAA